MDIEFTVNNGNSCGGEKLCGYVFDEIKKVTRRLAGNCREQVKTVIYQGSEHFK